MQVGLPRSDFGRAASHWVNFAKTGDPNGNGLPKWTGYTEAIEVLLALGDRIEMEVVLRKPALDFLETSFSSR